MPLDFQTIDVTFTKGLDTHTQRKLVVPGKWDTLINYSLSEDGSLKRRDGYEVLIADQAGNGLATRDDELLIVNGPTVSTVSEVGANVAKAVPGSLPYVDIDRLEVVQDETSHDQQDMAYGNGYACYVWRAYNAAGTRVGIRCTLIDLSTGAKLVNQNSLTTSATATSPRVVFDDDAFFLFYVDGTTVLAHVIDTATPTAVGGQTTLVTDADLSSKNFDACDFEDMGAVVVAYLVAAPGVNSVRAIGVIRTGTTPSVGAGPINVVSAANVTEASICGIACRSFGASSNALGVYVLHTAGGALASGLIGVVFNAGFTVPTAGPTNISATTPAVNGACHVTATPASTTTMQVFFDQQSSYLSADLRPLTSVTATAALAVTSNFAMLQSACFRINAAEASGPQGPFIAGKAFTSGSRTYLPVAMLENYNRLTLNANTDTLSTQCAFFLLDTTGAVANVSDPTWFVAASALYGTMGLYDSTLGGAAPTVGTPPSTPALASGFGICLQEKGRLELTNGINITPVGLAHIGMTPRTTTPGTYVPLEESLYASGGQLGNYDGKQMVQHGFPMHPEGISAVRVNTGGTAGKLTVGVHQVVAVYEWTDGAGDRHQSAPSTPVSVTVQLDTDTISVLVPTTQLAQQAGYNSASISTLRIVCYMTAAGGVSFYRAITNMPVTSAPGGLENSISASTVTYTIGTPLMPDARLTQNELLYTQPNQAGTTLPNIAPGPMHGIGVSQNRLWGFASDQRRYVYSQEPTPNTGLRFSDEGLGGALPSESGRGVIVTELDEKTILLCERGLFVVYGNGPTPSGSFNNFSEPQPIPSDVGCSDAGSVIAIPMGLMFKTPKGFYLLGRDLSTRYVGQGVARYDANNVTSAVMLEDRQEVRFTSSEGPTLVYAYEVDQWSVFAGETVDEDGECTDGAWWPATERYVALRPTSTTFPGLTQDTPNEWIDGVGDPLPLVAYAKARTGWLHVAALESFQRVRRVYLTGVATTAPTTTFTIGVDFDDAYAGDGGSAPGAYTATQDMDLITFNSIRAIDLRHKLRRQKCKSVAFTLTDDGGDADAAPITGLQAMALEVGRKRGVNKLPATQTVA